MLLVTFVHHKQRHSGAKAGMGRPAGWVLFGSTYLTLCQQVGDELRVVVQVEAAAQLEATAEVCHSHGLGR